MLTEIKKILFLRVPETHKGLLMLEVDRVAQVRKKVFIFTPAYSFHPS